MKTDSYLRKLGLKPTRKPTHSPQKYTGPCPFCGGTNRFSATEPSDQFPKGGCVCRPNSKGCGYHGNLVQLYSRTENVNEAEAAEALGIKYQTEQSALDRRLYAIAHKYELVGSKECGCGSAEQHSFDPTAWEQTLEAFLKSCVHDCGKMPPHCQTYLAKHGLPPAITAEYGICYNPHPKIFKPSDFGISDSENDLFVPSGLCFPLRDMHGKLFAVKIRQFHVKDKYYELTYGPRPCAFARPVNPNWPFVAVESENDVYTLDAIMAGTANLFSPGGAMKTFTTDEDKAVRQACWFIVAYDADATGQQNALRIHKEYPSCHKALIPLCSKDPSDALERKANLQMWLLANYPSFIRKRAIVKMQAAFLEKELAAMEGYWNLHHGLNTDIAFPVIYTQEELASKLSALSPGTAVAIFCPRDNAWQIAFGYELYTLDAEAALKGTFHLEGFDLKYVVADPYSSAKELALLNIGSRNVRSVAAYDRSEAHKESQQPKTRSFYPDFSDVHGLLTAYTAFERFTSAPDKAFVQKLDAARPFVVNPDGLTYDPVIYNAVLDSWADDAAMQGSITQYRNAAERSPGCLPVNYMAYGTVTGRYTTLNPNTQGIHGRLRKAFDAPEGWMYVSADFHMIQPRIVAAVCGDPVFHAPFLTGQDYYKYWIQRVVGCGGEISKRMRDFFKQPSLSILYGMGKDTFVESMVKKAQAADIPEIAALNLDNAKAAAIHDNFRKVFPGLARWDGAVKDASRDNGYVKTLSGRKIPLPRTDTGIDAHASVCYFAQGTEAEIMLDAIIAFGQQAAARGLHSKIALCLHDELLILCPEAEVDTVEELAQATLTKAFSERFPQENTAQLVEINHARCWGDLK